MPQKPRFSGHNTFPPRFHWFYKAFDALESGSKSKRAKAFDAEQGAISRLGVGKNMLQSIPYWSEAVGLLFNDQRLPANSELAELIFRSKSPVSDPYCEHHTTIWIMQANLAGRPAACKPFFATPFWLFNIHHESDFTAESAIEASLEHWKKEGVRVTYETIKRDMITYLNTYAPKHKGSLLAEEEVETPFAGLGLIRRIAGTDRYQMRREKRRTLSARVVAYALLDFWEKQGVSDSTLSFSKSLFAAGSPGSVFRLDNASLEGYAEEVERLSGRKLVLDTSSGGAMDWRHTGRDRLESLKLKILTK